MKTYDSIVLTSKMKDDKTIESVLYLANDAEISKHETIDKVKNCARIKLTDVMIDALFDHLNQLKNG